ncbi:hypothetical protein CN417_27705, partial [Bacillus thuringiensis]
RPIIGSKYFARILECTGILLFLFIDLVYRILYIVDRGGILGIPPLLFLHKILHIEKDFDVDIEK